MLPVPTGDGIAAVFSLFGVPLQPRRYTWRNFKLSRENVSAERMNHGGIANIKDYERVPPFLNEQENILVLAMIVNTTR